MEFGIEDKYMNANELFLKFMNLGPWVDDKQSRSIFQFIMKLRNQITKDDILLDLGAGQCRYKFFFENICNYISIDFGKGDRSWDYSNIDILGDITKIDYIKSNSASYILSTVVLEHINEPNEMIYHIHRILKKNGKLFLYVPFVASEHQIPYDFFRYTSFGLKYLCEKNGLNVIEIKPSNGPLYTGSRCLDHALGCFKSDRMINEIMRKSLRGLIRGFYPLFDYLEKNYKIKSEFPICWLLIAEKTAGKDGINEIGIKDKRRIIESIITCPKCKRDDISLQLQHKNSLYYICPNCGEEFHLTTNSINFLDTCFRDKY